MLAQRAAWEGPRWTRAVEDQSAPIPEEITSELGGIICNLGRRPHTGLHQISNGLVRRLNKLEKKHDFQFLVGLKAIRYLMTF